MSKPRLKGPTIGVRLPLELDAKIRAECLVVGLSPSAFLETVLLTHLDKGRDKKRPEKGIVPGHEHEKADIIAGGLARCKCGSVRSKNGSWS